MRHTLDKARRADIVIVGVGDMSEESNIVRMGWFSQKDIVEAKIAGAVGDIMGYDFIDLHGKPLPNLQGRVIGLTMDDLARISNVIAVASEPTKVQGILGALHTGVINTLATTTSNAIALLNLENAFHGAR